jgi:tryptophan 2,3-dioxygenase
MSPDLPNQRPIEAGVITDLSDRLSYGGYLRLDLLLSAQQPVSKPVHHDELLFIIQHQVAELWLKLVIHELRAALAELQRDNLGAVQKILARVKQVQRQLFEQWGVLETLTPSEYVKFRSVLGDASGFQSLQYRLIEFQLGNKNRDVIAVHKRDPAGYERLERALHAPSLYDEVLRVLSRRGYGIPEEYIDRDFSEPYAPSKAVTAAWLGVYHNAEKDWDLYEMAERLVDLDQKFQLWRFHHLKTVERVIGYKPGTGGTGGVSYLAKALELKFFPELWQVRTSM